MDKKNAGKSDEAVKKATGKTWDEWVGLLNSKGAKEMLHKDIARLIHEKGYIKKPKSWPAGRSFNEGWWCQSVTVGYEQKIGRRVAGQTSKGNFSTTVNRTLSGELDRVLKQWEEITKEEKGFNDIEIKALPRISSTEKWRYWKVDLADGSKINVNIGEKENGKISFSLTHYKLPDKKALVEWRKHWKEFLEKV
jgi:hypothetical protein